MKKLSSNDIVYDLWVLLRRTSHVIWKVRERELAQYGIAATQAGVLHIVQAIGRKATPAEISRRLLREPHSVSGLLARMEREGLIRKVKDLNRKNLVRVELTKKGRQAYNQSTKRESIRSIMSSLSDQEQQQLVSYLRTLCARTLKELGYKDMLM